MVDVVNVSRFYGRKTGVEQISFHIERGRRVGLLGPNGAGKSTIMKMLAGYQMPSAGSIVIGGKDMLKHPGEAGRSVGFMPEHPPLYPEMETKSFLMFCASIQGIGSCKPEVQRVMELTNIVHVKDRMIGNLSKGYKQRVGLAQALLGAPEFLILDEPTSGLDPLQIAEVRELLKGLGGEHTILMSSHILDEIVQTCEDVIIINQGKLVAEDTIENLRRKSEGSARFLLRTSASKEEVSEALWGLIGIERIEASGKRDGGIEYHIYGADSDSLRIETVKRLAGRGIPVMEISRPAPSLEEIFAGLINR